MIIAENNNGWGQDHCTAGLQFNKTVINQKRTYVIFLYKAKQLNPNL